MGVSTQAKNLHNRLETIDCKSCDYVNVCMCARAFCVCPSVCPCMFPCLSVFPVIDLSRLEFALVSYVMFF